MAHNLQCNHSYHEAVNHSFTHLCNYRYMETIADRIKHCRLSRGLSQQQVATKAKVSRVSVTKWESGATENIKLINLLALCSLFEVTAEELISGSKLLPTLNQDRAIYKNDPGVFFDNDSAAQKSAFIVKIKPKSKRELLSERIAQAIEHINEDGLLRALERVETLVEEYPREAKQTPSS